jgi:hypothetical protein
LTKGIFIISYSVQDIWCGNLRKRGPWGDLGVDRRIILKWIFRKCDVGGRE